ncbi:hypothetical protein ACTI_54220 [Actinoplanes sp. OR16]|uniref:hypothetical protein n=1 Tax=Actinoplanes sp. OR16 TaxID=946334 RepID=UPI000F71AB03|nr:hypothetical protein [Actinoplanes sp. OR16]BBH68737.1 hypothetical protein ACTI_54220 [Actinoplanes sp. OR16]
MIERLDDVDWAGLVHAYGPADDVPDLIRGLLSENADKREESRDGLISAIVHQGTRYSASAPAVPFLLAILADSTTPDRGELVSFLEYLATGQDSDPEWDRFDVEEEIGGLGRIVYDAVAEGIPLFIELLADDDAEVAIPAARALAVFPEHAAVIAPALARAAAVIDAPVPLTTTALLALGVTAPDASPYADLLDRRLTDSDNAIRQAAALTATRLRGNPTQSPEALAAPPRILARSLADTPFSTWHNYLLGQLAERDLDTTNWDERESDRTWADLTPAQRDFVDQLCERPDIFARERIMRPLVWAGLPGTLPELRAFRPS